jgi:glycosyltransferase involved in cell wall biosynthesis
MKKWVNRKSRIRGSLTVNIITKNEEKNILKAIESIKDLADEIIVIDTGSKDNTAKEATAAGAVVYQDKWDDDFSKPRNLALEKSKSGWILSLDADEIVPKRGREEIVEMIKRPEVVGWRIETMNFCLDHRKLDVKVNDGYYEEGRKHKFYIGSEKTRLFQKIPGVKWDFPIHEVVDASIGSIGGRFGKGFIKVLHLHKEMSEEEIKKKTEFYLGLCEKKVKQYPKMGHAWGELAACELHKRLYLRAARSYYNAIKYGEDIAKNRYGYAGVLKILGNKKESDQEVERALCKDFPNLTTIK